MKAVKDLYEKSVEIAEKEIETSLAGKHFLRSLLLEEIEKQSRKLKNELSKKLNESSIGKENKDELIEQFENDLLDFIEGWSYTNVRKTDDALLASIKNISLEDKKKLIKNLKEKKSELLDVLLDIISETLTFETVYNLPDEDIKKLLGEVDQQDLAAALKAESEDIQKRFFNNMSERAVDMLKEDMEFMGPVTKNSCIAAQKRIIKILLNPPVYKTLD